MKKTVNFYYFKKEFEIYDRSYSFKEGLSELFEYLEQYEDDTGEQIELDVMSLCCDYSEDKLKNVLQEHDLESLDDLRDNTQVIMVGSEEEENPTIIYQVF